MYSLHYYIYDAIKLFQFINIYNARSYAFHSIYKSLLHAATCTEMRNI